MDENKLKKYLEEGYILFYKNGTIEVEKAPMFGDINLSYSDGKLNLLTKRETEKYVYWEQLRGVP